MGLRINIVTFPDESSVFTVAGLSNVASAALSCCLGGGAAPGNIVAGLNIMGFYTININKLFVRLVG